MLRLFLLFTLVPSLELFLLLQIGVAVGPTLTFAIVVLTGVVGSWLARREGWNLLGELSADLQKGIPPATRLAEGVLVLIGGVLLVTPGVLTDFLGFSLMIPFTRKLIAPRLITYLSTRFEIKATMGPVTPIHPSGESGRQPEESDTIEQTDSRPFSSPFDDLP
jgi:UPF0716 protein FxsA